MSVPLVPLVEPVKEDIYIPPLDTLNVKIRNLRVTDEEPQRFAINISYIDQLLVSGVIKSIGAKTVTKERTVLKGFMTYDPSDYEKMYLMADNPLVVKMQPLKSVEQAQSHTSQHSISCMSSAKTDTSTRCVENISCCNVDILPLFIGKHKMDVKKRMEPLIEPPVLRRKSWDNLPLLSMEVSVIKNKLNEYHHKKLKQANVMKITLLASYNMLIPYDDEFIYTAASKMPAHNETNLGLVMFNQGRRVPRRFNSLSFYPKWESLRLGDEVFDKGDEKFVCYLKDIQNDDNIDLQQYMNNYPAFYTTLWGSFHRSLLLDVDHWLWKHMRQYHWPLEVHIYGEKGGHSFMGFLNLFKLLYPGETTIRLAVPLQWINAEAMMAKCGCELLLSPNEKAPSTAPTTQKASKTESGATNTSTDRVTIRATGSDDNSAFVVVEIKLARPLKKIVIPPLIPLTEINDMLKEMEQAGPLKRECSGRGQLDRDWQATVRSAAHSIRKVPYYGMTEFCHFHRQFSETRTRVELTTSCWQDAAVYVNNNFVVQDFLRSDDTFEEMLMMSHACLMRTACETLVGVDNWQNVDPTLRAARQARQMQDIPHAMELYLQLVVQKPRDANSWRELSTCLMDVDRDWANVCMNKSVVLDPRHPLSLLSKGCMIFEEDPALAEPFFVALLALYPYWSSAWIIASTYYIERELFHMADQIIALNFTSEDSGVSVEVYLLGISVPRTHGEGPTQEFDFPRSWDHELGDWWDNTPILPGMSPHLDAADLLLRLRAVTLAEACVAQALSEAGESAAYFHLVALCCRLRGDVEDALCHIHAGIEKYGEIGYLRNLEAECYHKLKNIPAATAAFEKAGSSSCAYSILLSTPTREPQRARTVLVDLVRRQPSAYAWVALADDWMTKAAVGGGDDGITTDEQVAAKTCAAACCIQALKADRRAGKAWAQLAKLVKPSARRLHCRSMAESCGYIFMSEQRSESYNESKQSLCYHLGKALRECRCILCEKIKF